MCFFFKHKTAYEMRISDWSSDVCSSDLGGRFGCTHRDTTGSRAYGRQVRERFSGHGRRSSQRRQGPALRLYGTIGHGDALQKRGAASLDRKSVVSGKRVSVRVDHGGRRILKKKRKQKKPA